MQIEFNGQMYKLETLVSLMGFGRQETVTTQELVIVAGPRYESKLRPICTYYNNRLYVLTGTIEDDKAYQTVCILTKHILKKALMSGVEAIIDTYVSPAKPVLVSENQRINKAMAALSKHHPDEEAYVLPARHEPKSHIAMSDKTRTALHVLEAAMSRKNEVEKSDWN
jgi:hypothetical protein